VLRWIQVQTEDVSGLAFELGIVAGQATLQAVRFETGFLPHPVDSVSQPRRQHRGFLPGMVRVQPIDAGGEESLFPARMMVGALVCRRRLMVLKEAPSASIRMSLARKT
jgi:hypothetical protein